MERSFSLPLTFHNLWTILLMVTLLAWILLVTWRLWRAGRLHWRTRHSGILYLDKLSLHVGELQRILRQHFNQLLRMRPTVPAREVGQVQVIAHLQPESLRMSQMDEKVCIAFQVDAIEACRLHIHWLHSDLQSEQLDRFDLEMGQSLPAGCGQEVVLDDLTTLNEAESVESAERILLICLSVPESLQQLTFVSVRCPTGSETWHPEVLHQLVRWPLTGETRQILGIYGTEEEGEDEGDSGNASLECKVCFDHRRDVIVLPCRHCSVCLSCLRSLRDERCPLCRSSFSAYLLLPLTDRPAPR